MNDYLGNAADYNIGVAAISGNYWWSYNLKSGQPELWPGMGNVYNSRNGYAYEKTWDGFSLGGAVGPPQLKGGASVSHGVTTYFKSLNKQYNLVPQTKGYQR